MIDLVLMKCEKDPRRVFSLTDKEIQEHLSYIFGWSELDGTIEKEFTFSDLFRAVAFINKIAQVADQEGHYPKICVEKNIVHISLSTKEIDCLTKNDFIIAAKIDSIFQMK